MASRVHQVPEMLNPHFGFWYTVDQILHRGTTAFQKIELARSPEFGNVLLLDGIMQVAEKNDFQYHEPMVHPAMIAHPNPRKVLAIGAGDGGILREVLKYPCVTSVDFVELDKGVVDFSRKYLKKVHGGSFDDPRVHANYVDGRSFVEQHPASFDVVIMDLTDPFGPAAMLYTKEFFRLVKRSFRTGAGIFVMQSQSPISRPKAFGCINRTLNSVFGHVCPLYLYIQMYAVLWSITTASDRLDLNRTSDATIAARIKKYGLRDLMLYTPQTHRSMLTVYPYIADILRRKAPVITDARHEFPDNFLHSEIVDCTHGQKKSPRRP